jgi:hypothetical protein
VAEGGGGQRRSGGGGDRLKRRVDGDGVESGRDLESGGDLENFGMKSKTTLGRLLFIGSKYQQEPLLIVLESEPKRFWFKTTANEGITSSD